MKVELTQINKPPQKKTIKDLVAGDVAVIQDWNSHTGKIITVFDIKGDLYAASIGTGDWWLCGNFWFEVRLLTPGEAIVVKGE